MSGLAYTKMHGCGNDFIMLDGRMGVPPARLERLAAALCDRRRGLGADGLVVLYPAEGEADFVMRYVNASGLPGALCGNGARCAARFAHAIGLAGPLARFATDAGLVRTEIDADGVAIDLPPPGDIRVDLQLSLDSTEMRVHALRVGVPHAVAFVQDLDGFPVARYGPLLRAHPIFPEGCNANFIELRAGEIAMRTFERGVEAETLACGTGAAASAAIALLLGLTPPSVVIRTRSGDRLEVSLRQLGGRFEGARLRGPTETVAMGSIDEQYLAHRGLA